MIVFLRFFYMLKLLLRGSELKSQLLPHRIFPLKEIFFPFFFFFPNQAEDEVNKIYSSMRMFVILRNYQNLKQEKRIILIISC